MPSHTLSLSDSAWTVRAAQPHPPAPADPIPATVPGCVHTDLLAAGLIPDPFVDANELDVRWVGETDWTYETTFRVCPTMFSHEHLDLVFDGLDTFATIALNGVAIGQTANMHRSYRFEIGALVREGVNELTIEFASAVRRAEELRAAEAPWPSASFGRPFNYVRKMACSWGWDWGPWLTTAGVWKAARVECWNETRLESVRPTAVVDDGDVGGVSVRVATVGAAVKVQVTLADPDGAAIAHADVAVSESPVVCDVDAGAVRRWWPHTYGPQPLYHLTVELIDAAGAVVDVWQRRLGFRTVEIDTAADAVGSAFTFVINGKPIFARGVNWIPDDPFPSRITAERLRDRLAHARRANVDLVRIWGGGLYESDDFYDVCDEFGILVWQDFCFACAAYPEDLLADEVEAEARHNVERLMSHASLALWNGNNENIWGWFDWGWQKPLAGRPWGGGFYLDLLPRIVAEIDPARPYWPGSPYSGSMTVAANADAHGCTHVWDVWNALDYERYRDHTPRFVAEFGWQAPPTWQTLRSSISDEPLRPDSPGMRHHQKAADGDVKLARGLRAHTGVPADFESWMWATQLMQARAVTTGIEHFRSLRGTCMGTIWWQLNDCWPVTSWAVVDSGGQPKPAWYALRAAYRPRLLTVQPRGSALVLFAVNEGLDAWQVDGTIRRMTFAGGVLAEQRVSGTVQPGSVAAIEIEGDVARPGDTGAELLVADAGDDRAVWWFSPDKDLALERPRFTIGSTECGCGDRLITFLAHNLVRDLTVLPDRLVPGATADRQLVTLLPDESVTITIRGGNGHTPVQFTEPPACWSAYSALGRT